jgi:malate dehydrogenase (oxaloacetate-decarboxylating)
VLEAVESALSGAGAAGTAIVRLMRAGGAGQVAVFDSHGVLHPGQKDIKDEKRWLAEHTAARGS